MPFSTHALPILTVLSSLRTALHDHSTAVLDAPPGAGKTTVVPLEFLTADWLGPGRIIMLEPRRLAARAAARRLAQNLGEQVGQTVGYRMRLESCVGPATRVEVVTEGILTRMLQDDPELTGVGLVIFDEFHERSLQADCALALTLDVQKSLRPELRILIMSATLPTGELLELLDQPPLVRTQGRLFPVRTVYCDRRDVGSGGGGGGDIAPGVAAAIVRLLNSEPGSMLVFLPGQAEIRRVHARLKMAGLPGHVRVTALYGNLPLAAQQQAIEPCRPGERKVVLSTDIAETSLTIEGVRLVLDSGLRRRPCFDARTGMTRLETVRISQAASEQRRGRAGRLEPGVCWRLWPEFEQATRLAFEPPEMANADLAGLALELACWGVSEPQALRWLDQPPPAAWNQARLLLHELGALDHTGKVTRHGREMQKLGMHPRLAHMVMLAVQWNLGPLACEIAALLTERDIMLSPKGPPDPDIRLRIAALRHPDEAGDDARINPTALRQVRQAARDWQRRLVAVAPLRKSQYPAVMASDQVGLLLALAYPERVARRRDGTKNRFLMANGRGATLAETSQLTLEQYLAVAHVDDAGADAGMQLAAPITLETLENCFAESLTEERIVEWDEQRNSVQAQSLRKLGSLVLRSGPGRDVTPEERLAALLDGIRRNGLECLPWSRDVRNWQSRTLFVRDLNDAPDWPDLGDSRLLSTLEQWLAPFLNGMSRLTELARVDLQAALQLQLSRGQLQRLQALAPSHLTIPSGARIRLDYNTDNHQPIMKVRIQEMFGCMTNPTVAAGRVPVVLHLLSPAQRPVQVTTDIAGFWTNSYHYVRKEMRGRYPKHAWPENPGAPQ